jgi:UDP-N-acetylmuramate--alanine ligase
MAARQSVGVTGSHGKGTVAALIAAALLRHGDDPLAIIGAPVRTFGGSVQLGSGPLVAEVDDSDGSLSRITADVAVLTNSWFDHPIFGRSLTENRRDLSVFLENTPADGHVILGRQKELRLMARGARARVMALGRDFDGSTRTVSRSGEVVEVTDLDGSRFHVEVNILAGNLADDVAMAFMALRAIGLSGEQAAVSLGALTGLSRRVEFIGEASGVCVYDDLGKHPESLSAVLQEIRKRTSGRLHLLFEPFLHADLLRWRSRWIKVLAQADSVIVLPVELRQSFPVPRRAPRDWATPLGERLINAETRLEAAEVVSQIARSGDSVLIAGCVDDLDEVAPWVLERL